MFCTKCGKENEDGTKFCVYCGNTLDDEVIVEAGGNLNPDINDQATQVMSAQTATTILPPIYESGSPQQNTNFVQGAYGNQNDANGFASTPVYNPVNPVNAYAQQPDAGQNSGGKKGIVIAIVAVCVIAAIVVAAVFVLPNITKQEENQAADSQTAATEQNSGNEPTTQNASVVEDAEKTEHTVVFETNGGTVYDQMTVKSGDVITSPQDPIRYGYIFKGWYLDNSFKKPVKFPYTVKQDDPSQLILYAKWVDENASRNSTSTSSYDGSVFPESSSEYLSDSEVRKLSLSKVQRAINEIYARNGYIFHKSETEKRYFNSQPWYHGDESSDEVVRKRFNKYERANMKKLQEARERLSN